MEPVLLQDTDDGQSVHTDCFGALANWYSFLLSSDGRDSN